MHRAKKKYDGRLKNGTKASPRMGWGAWQAWWCRRQLCRRENLFSINFAHLQYSILAPWQGNPPTTFFRAHAFTCLLSCKKCGCHCWNQFIGQMVIWKPYPRWQQITLTTNLISMTALYQCHSCFCVCVKVTVCELGCPPTRREY